MEISMDLIEKTACAIASELYLSPWEGLESGDKEVCRRLARAAANIVIPAAQVKIQDLRCAAAGNFSPAYSGAEGVARTDSFAEAWKAVGALLPNIDTADRAS